jgi:hypothetical protein
MELSVDEGPGRNIKRHERVTVLRLAGRRGAQTKTGYPLEDTPRAIIGGVDDRWQQYRTGP